MDKTALSYWFPLIEAAGIPVPRTKIITMPEDAQKDIWAGFDGQEGPGGLKPFVADLAAVAKDFGFPFFLRTDHTSGKHDWEHTCFVSRPEDLVQRVFAIAEYSELNGMFGELPWSTWVLRELLPTVSFGVCPRFGNMPVCREFRFFVDNGKVRCSHPYWPRDSLEQGGADSSIDYAELCRMPDEAALRTLAERTGAAVGGSWSIDILETRRGWFVTDMAEAHKSFHWEGCDGAHYNLPASADQTIMGPG